MEPVTGVFRSREKASEAANALHCAGFSSDRINVLLPGASEQAGAFDAHLGHRATRSRGRRLWRRPGGHAGNGCWLRVVATVLIPGVGPVVAVGIAAAALLGIGGAVTGAKVGAAVDHQSSEGLPADEVFFYEDALRQGKSVVLAMADDGREMERAREVFEACGRGKSGCRARRLVARVARRGEGTIPRDGPELRRRPGGIPRGVRSSAAPLGAREVDGGGDGSSEEAVSGPLEHRAVSPRIRARAGILGGA